MPTEVYPSGSGAYLSSSLPFHPSWSSPMPPTGPARAMDLLAPSVPRRIPGSVLPNGLRNLWAPYAGETYRPSAEGAASIQGNTNAYGGGGGAPPSVNINGSVVAPRAMSPIGGGGGGSVIAPSSIGLGGYREDDGWNGAMGRVHQGHGPDLSSTAGPLGHLRAPTSIGIKANGSVIGGGGGNGSSAGWMDVPASWSNHARMTPGMLAPHGPPIGDAMPRSYGHSPAPIPSSYSHSHGGRSRRESVPLPMPMPRDKDNCPECRESRAARYHEHQHRRHASAGPLPQVPTINVESPYRHGQARELSVSIHRGGRDGSSDSGDRLERRASGRSKHSHSHSRCSECERGHIA